MKKNWFWADGYSQKYKLGKHGSILTINISMKIQAYMKDENDKLIEYWIS